MTVSAINQKDDLAKELETIKKSLKSCTGDIQTIKTLYKNSEWF
jgi:hypothetical protein